MQILDRVSCWAKSYFSPNFGPREFNGPRDPQLPAPKSSEAEARATTATVSRAFFLPLSPATGARVSSIRRGGGGARSPEMAGYEREKKRLLDLAADSGFERDLAADCLDRIVRLYGNRRSTSFPSSSSLRCRRFPLPIMQEDFSVVNWGFELGIFLVLGSLEGSKCYGSSFD